MKSWAVRAAVFAILMAVLSSSSAHATVPVCSNFNNQTVQGWAPAFIAPNVNVNVTPTGGPSGNSDPFLRTEDASGASLLEAPASYKGNWNDLNCGQLCWNMKIIDDGDSSATQNIAPYVIVTSGTLRAQWVANYTINENSGWKQVCVQLGPICNGQFPTNNTGQWQMLDGAPQSSFTTLMSNVTNVYFPVDYGPFPREKTGYDNVCLSEAPCPCDCFIGRCLDVWRETVLCRPGPGNFYLYSFTLTNFTKQVVGAYAISAPSGITLSPPAFNGPFVQGVSTTHTIAIGGATPGQTVCLEFTAWSPSGARICCVKRCIKIPSCPCIQIRAQQNECVNGKPAITFNLDNLSAGTVTDLMVIPTPSTVQLSPNWFHFNTPVPTYGSFPPVTIQFPTAQPGSGVCLHFVAVNNTPGGGGVCCSFDVCIAVPFCSNQGCCPGPCCLPRLALISQALAEMDGVGLSLEDKTVPGSVGGAAWIQEADRSSGLLMYTDEPLQPGDLVTVSGEITTDGYNRVLMVQSLVKADFLVPPTPPRPLLMNNRTLGGGDLNDFTFGVTGGIGLFNVGLLVQTWGRVTTVGTGFFYVDDGSRLHDPTGNLGVRVFAEGLSSPPVGSLVSVTGLISASLYVPTGQSIPVLVPRTQSDISGPLESPGGPLPGAPAIAEPRKITPVDFSVVR